MNVLIFLTGAVFGVGVVAVCRMIYPNIEMELVEQIDEDAETIVNLAKALQPLAEEFQETAKRAELHLNRMQKELDEIREKMKGGEQDA